LAAVSPAVCSCEDAGAQFYYPTVLFHGRDV
jgi:hypothetical protein